MHYRKWMNLFISYPALKSPRASVTCCRAPAMTGAALEASPPCGPSAISGISRAVHAWGYRSSLLAHKMRSTFSPPAYLGAAIRSPLALRVRMRLRLSRAQSMLHRCFSSVNPQNQKDDDDDYQVRATKSSDGLRESMPKVSTIDWRQQIYTIPNMITLARIATCPFIALAIANDMKKTALTACIAAGVSDWLDGYIAKNYNAATTLGAFLDPLADKIFIGSMAVGLTASGLLPWPVAFVVVGRDVLLVLGSFIIRAREKRATDAFFDLSTTTFHIKPSLLSKVNTFTQFVLLCSTFGSFAVGWPSAAMIEPLWYITPITTIASGLGYLNGSGLNRKKMTEMAKEFRRKTKT